MLLNKVEGRLREGIEKGLFKTSSKKNGVGMGLKTKTFLYFYLCLAYLAMHIFVLKRHLNMLEFWMFILDQ